MRLVLIVVAALFAVNALAQDTARKKATGKKHQVAHKKPTPEQLRKFKELEKKQVR